MSTTTVVRLKVRFEDRSAAASCLQGLRRIPGASVTVIRGRVTLEDATYDLELRGEGRLVEQAVSKLRKLARLRSKAEAEVQPV